MAIRTRKRPPFGYSFGLVEISLVAGMLLFYLFLVVWLPFAVR